MVTGPFSDLLCPVFLRLHVKITVEIVVSRKKERQATDGT